MLNQKKISLVFPAFNEAGNITQAIDNFKALKLIDEIIVVDNNSTDRTAEIAKTKGVKIIKEVRQGYGFALIRGLKQATGDYIVLTEPDGTFMAKDLLRLLKYSSSYDMVTGTRTNPQYFTRDANMGYFLRFGNIFVAKLIQILYNTSSLSDCGCTFRIIKKSLITKLLPKFTVGGQHFLAELVVLTALTGGSIYEIPVRYKKRVGRSKITGSLKTSISVGLHMIGTLIKYKFNLKI